MATTTVEIPDDRLPETEAYKDKLGELLFLALSQVKIQEALLLCQRGVISFGRTTELAGIVVSNSRPLTTEEINRLSSQPVKV